MVKTETSNEEVILLLTGEEWGDKRLTTVKAVLDEYEPGTYWFDGGFAHLEPCWFEHCANQGVKVPYMIGQKVRLTGSSYRPFHGEEREVVKYVERQGDWLPRLDDGLEVYSDEDAGTDWSVTPVVGADAPPPLEDWETRLEEHDKKEAVRKEVEDEIIAYLRRVEAETRDAIQEMLYAHPNPNLARLKELAAEVYAHGIIAEIVATGEYRD